MKRERKLYLVPQTTMTQVQIEGTFASSGQDEGTSIENGTNIESGEHGGGAEIGDGIEWE